MSSEILRVRIDGYIELRRSLGYKTSVNEHVLRDFAATAVLFHRAHAVSPARQSTDSGQLPRYLPAAASIPGGPRAKNRRACGSPISTRRPSWISWITLRRSARIRSNPGTCAWRRSARSFALSRCGILKLWLDASPAPPDSPAFPSARGATLSRDGVNYILQSAIREAAKTCPSLTTKRVSPHVLRHTTAMHLLQSGNDITIIALWLGHESPETTQVYVEADLKSKEQALQNVAPAGKGFRRFQPSDALLTFLDNL